MKLRITEIDSLVAFMNAQIMEFIDKKKESIKYKELIKERYNARYGEEIKRAKKITTKLAKVREEALELYKELNPNSYIPSSLNRFETKLLPLSYRDNIVNSINSEFKLKSPNLVLLKAKLILSLNDESVSTAVTRLIAEFTS